MCEQPLGDTRVNCSVVTSLHGFMSGTIHNDFIAMAMTLAMGLTNGWTSVNCMLHGRKMVPEAVREEGGYILTLSMSTGITAGVLLAIPVNYAASHWL